MSDDLLYVDKFRQVGRQMVIVGEESLPVEVALGKWYCLTHRPRNLSCAYPLTIALQHESYKSTGQWRHLGSLRVTSTIKVYDVHPDYEPLTLFDTPEVEIVVNDSGHRYFDVELVKDNQGKAIMLSIHREPVWFEDTDYDSRD